MRVEHHGMTFPFHSHRGITGFSIQILFFSHHVNDAALKKKLMKSPRVWEKGREDFPLIFTLNEKTVGALEKACLQDIFEES
jgi:thiamine monophosphate kinase